MADVVLPLPPGLTRKQRANLKRLLPAVLTGKVPDPTGGMVEQLHLRVGFLILGLFKQAFLAKSRGGTDEAGQRWTPLSPKTVAHGRRHPGLAKAKSKAAKQGRAGRPLLTAGQDKTWRGVYAQALHRALGKGASQANAGAHAAALAWAVVKAQGGQTILGKYGNASHEILRDTGVLFNSLSPGVATVRAEPGAVVIGTNVPYAGPLHRGTKNIPARPLWPEPDQWPASWRQQVRDLYADGAREIAQELVTRGLV